MANEPPELVMTAIDEAEERPPGRVHRTAAERPLPRPRLSSGIKSLLGPGERKHGRRLFLRGRQVKCPLGMTDQALSNTFQGGLNRIGV